MKTVKIPVIASVAWQSSLYKTFSRMFAAFGMVMMFVVSGWGASNNPTVSLSCTPVDVTELDSGTQNVTCTIALSVAPDTKDIKLKVTTGGTATSSTDFVAPSSSTFTFAKNTGTLTQNFTYGIKGDTSVESDETIIATLSDNGTHSNQTFSFSTATQTIKIINDDTSYTSNNTRPFTQAYMTNVKGNIKMIGNSVLGLNASGGCTTSANNAVDAVNIDLDSDPATFNSTSANLAFPAGVTGTKIKYAALYWQGRLGVGTLSANAAAAKTVKLKLPGGSYQTLTSIASKFNWTINAGNGDDYQGVVDITNLLKTNVNQYATSSGYSQTIWVADVKALTGAKNLFGAWSLIVVYEDDTTTLKNLTVYDGYRKITNNDSVPITLSGFLTPSAGTVNASFLIFGGEGDIGYGDKVTLSNKSGTHISLGEVFTSSISYTDGNNIDSRNPACANTLGVDIHSYAVGNSVGGLDIIKNAQTETTVTLSSFKSNASDANSYDTYFPGLFAFSTDIYAPDIQITKTPSTSSSGALSAGQQIDYTASFTNGGRETAKEITIYDDFTQNLLKRTDGNDTDPAIYLSDMLERNATKIKQSIRLSSVDSTSTWHCAQGLSGIPGCTVYDANCSVDYTGDAGTTATKAWCYVPTIAVGSTYTMKFSVNIAADPDTQGQSVLVENQMFASYKDNVTGISMPNASSNVANAGSYNYAQNIAAVGFDTRETSIAEADNNRSITTKTTNKPFQLNVVSLNTSGSIAAYQGLDNTRVYLSIFNTDQCSLSDTEKLAVVNMNPVNNNFVEFDNGQTTRLSLDMNSLNAGKDKKIALNYINWSAAFQQANFNCSNSNTDAVLKGVPQCLNADDKIGDVFGIATQNACAGGEAHGMNPAVSNPACQSNSYNGNNVPDSPYNNEYGCYQCISGMAGTVTCSTDNFAIRPNRLDVNSTNAHFPNLLRSAEDYNTTINAYNFNSTTNTLDYNVTDANSTYVLTTTKYMKNNEVNASMSGTAAFAAGGFDMQNGVSAKAGVTGEIAGLSFNDVGKININIQDQNWSAVDNDDTPMNCDANGTYVCGDKNVTFIPHHFSFSNPGLGITNNNGPAGTFTYIANEVDQMAGRIYTTIRAENKDNALTINFASSPLWENNVTVIPVVTKATYLYPDANETNITNLPIGFFGGAKTITYNEDNTSQYLRFNFRRDINLPQNPFDVNGSDLNISMTSHYVDADDAAKTADITGSRLGTVSPADGNSTFVYGRIIPRDVRVFGAVPFSANAWYEVFNAPRIGTTSLAPSRNDGIWYINQLHDDTNDGNGEVTVVVTGANPTNAAAVNGLETYGFAAQTPPYSAKAHINTDPWLWYGVNALTYHDPDGTHLNCLTHPCFNINVVPPVIKTGSAKSGAEDEKSSKSSTSEGTGWHSTTDYAPAIR